MYFQGQKAPEGQMIKSGTLVIISGWITLIGVIVVIAVMWLNTTPGNITATDPDFVPLNIDSITEQSITELNSLTKNGNLPVVASPADLGRDNPFAPY
jgi:hypothetical protein